jgi:plasmid stability protein
MATITIRNLDESVKRKLQVRAALNGRSMEAEVREVLADFADEPPRRTVAGTEIEEDFGTAAGRLFAPLGGVELQVPQRDRSPRPIPTFD